MNKSLFHQQTRMAFQIETLVRVYYFALLGIINGMALPALKPGYQYNRLITTWPVEWLHMIGLKVGIPLILLGTIGSLLLAGLMPRKQWTRLVAFGFIFFFNAYNSSFGAVTHLYQFWLWTAFALALIPTVDNLNLRKNRQLLLNGWITAQSLCLMFYVLSGLWKALGALLQGLNGEPTVFSPGGLSYHVASEMIRAGSKPLLADLIFNHPWLSPPLAILVAATQMGCIFVLLKPKWQRSWGVALLGFHLGTFFTLQITYPTNFVLVCVLFVASPFSSIQLNWITRLQRYYKAR